MPEDTLVVCCFRSKTQMPFCWQCTNYYVFGGAGRGFVSDSG